jgi:hypothetical protein
MLQRAIWRRELYFFGFILRFYYFCACALERTQAAKSEASIDSRRDLLRVGLLNVCVVYTSLRIYSVIRDILARPQERILQVI